MPQIDNDLPAPIGGTLYIVASPIGNLADITVRALTHLRAARLILCEDTRRGAILCRHYDITARLVSCHAHNERGRIPLLLRALRNSECVCYISDAGTPGINDPGAQLTHAARTAGHNVVPLPGACSITALLSASGERIKSFSFIGFAPRGAGRRATAIQQIVARAEPVVLYESPHRVVPLVAEIARLAPRRVVVIGRELTKRFEEIIKAPARTIAERLCASPPRGEYTILITAHEGS